jgi:hypothetical protein
MQMDEHKDIRWIPRRIRSQMPKVCGNCGSTEGLNIHHVVPLSLGGTTQPGNLIVLCTKCHAIIHSREGYNGDIPHGQLIKAGIAKRKARGEHIGSFRKPREPILRMIAQHCTCFEGGQWTEEEIMRACGIKRTLFHECLNELLKNKREGKWPYDFPEPKQIRDRPMHAKSIRVKRRETGYKPSRITQPKPGQF